SASFYRGRLFMGEAYFYLKQYNEAESNFQISFNKDRQDELLYYYLYYLGNINYYKGNFAEAEEQLREAGKLYPGFSEASYSLALICLKTGREMEALEFFERAVKEDPAIGKMKLKEFEDYLAQENLQEGKMIPSPPGG
ncbi:MAG: tetratricopeptide repeat protein, partial [Firmicutes bacterium]|nr:tetratricopeptide repeat protein [Bacillota bacterium]